MAGPDDPVRAELKRLEGMWRVVATEVGGKETAEGAGGLKNVVIFSGDKCTLKNGGVTIENTFAIDPTKNPKWMDVTRTADKMTWPGIYELNGDTLRAVFQGAKGGRRPAEFKTRPGGPELLTTYQRVKL
jgi:uncharacterized protein (TIGR03067 family)